MSSILPIISKFISNLIDGNVGPLVLVLFLSVILAAYIGWTLRGWISRVNSSMLKTDNLESKVEKTNSVLQEIRDMVNQIWGKIGMPPKEPILERQSPVGLTDYGKSISEKLGAGDWANKKVNQIAPLLKGKQSYEIQAFCFDVVKFVDKRKELPPDFMSDDLNIMIREYAFKLGTDETNLHDIFAIELRNAVMYNLGMSLDSLD